MTIDVFADIACPWCYIGEAHLAEALRQRPRLDVRRRWRPFQLQPGLPREGLGREFFLEKFGGQSAMEAAFGHVTRAGAAAGLSFDFDRLAGAPNTLDAHRLVLLARVHGREWEMADALFEGYFAGGRDLNDAEDLAALAEHAGIPGADAHQLLAGDRFDADVQQSQEIARRAGIGGVPLYLFGDQFALSGAQPVHAFAQALDRLASVEAPDPTADESSRQRGAANG
ncbi:MAG: DsbA family oxidoreductase [Bacteroidota bacterium]